MANAGSSFFKTSTTISGDTNTITTPTITLHVTDATPGNETSVALPASTKLLIMRNRGNGIIQLAYTALASGTNFVTLHRGTAHYREGISASASITLFVQSPKASQTLEIETWA